MTPFLAVVACVIIAFLLPARFDPAVWLKEFNERKRDDER